MDKEQWYIEWYDRTIRYAQRRLDPSTPIALTADKSFIQSIDGQIAVLTASNILSRMSPSVVLAFPDVGIVSCLPWSNMSLHQAALSGMRAANPHAHYPVRDLDPGDFRFHVGPCGAEYLVHGTGWNAYVGPGPSPLVDVSETNGIGAALAVIIGAGQLFRAPFASFAEPVVCNAFDWEITASTSPAKANIPIGELFAVGLGSVGSAALYFLTLRNA